MSIKTVGELKRALKDVPDAEQLHVEFQAELDRGDVDFTLEVQTIREWNRGILLICKSVS